MAIEYVWSLPNLERDVKSATLRAAECRRRIGEFPRQMANSLRHRMERVGLLLTLSPRTSWHLNPSPKPKC